MVKSRKVSKMISNGFLPDYRHTIETVSESDYDPEFITMQDSYVSSRQCYSYNSDVQNNPPMPVLRFSLHRMSLLEKKKLETRLKGELERVRRLQTDISSYDTDSVMWPPDNMEGLHMKKLPPGRNGLHSKVGATVKHGFKRAANFDSLMKECSAVLTGMMRQKKAQIFNSPVDVVKFNIPDYFDIIKHPMDLGTIKGKLLSKQYSNPMEFASDVRLTFNNAMTYNPKTNGVHILAQTMSKSFESRWKPIEKKILSMAADESMKLVPNVTMEPPSKKQKLCPEPNVQREKQGTMSNEEKQRLSSELDSLLEELPDNIINFLKESSQNGNQVTEDEIEIDFDNLSDGILFTLRRLLDNYIMEKHKKNSKPELSKIKDGFVAQTNKAQLDEPAEEEVDVVGNDPPPLSSSPPENDDKDETRGSLRSSSSESGSSSSESQSSANENDGGDNSVAVNASNGNGDIEAQHQSEGDADLSKGNTENLSSSNSTDCRQEGENAPSERQVSPEKLYRAALLKGRFADIIVKAQENTVEKGNRPDPAKLKLEREELERRRKEEKARLQAEAKAAEEARRNAEMEAAAEARKKREVEREAARQALQQMEKTVDIDEGSHYIEDFDIIGSERLQQSLAAAESDDVEEFHSRNAGGGNPLEQLGLYMKNDDDFEDEEVEPESIPPDISIFPEEGEINCES